MCGVQLGLQQVRIPIKEETQVRCVKSQSIHFEPSLCFMWCQEDEDWSDNADMQFATHTQFITPWTGDFLELLTGLSPCSPEPAIKVKVKLSLCLTKHHAMKTHWGSGGIAQRIFDLGTRLR
jgi:hypothetical protein